MGRWGGPVRVGGVFVVGWCRDGRWYGVLSPAEAAVGVAVVAVAEGVKQRIEAAGCGGDVDGVEELEVVGVFEEQS